MKNKEKYKDVILEMACDGRRFAVDEKTELLEMCEGKPCSECLFCGDCENKHRIWAEEEYGSRRLIDWSKVAVDTPIYVRGSKYDMWAKRHFAEYKNERVYAFADGKTSFTNEGRELVDWDYAELAEVEKEN